jgi:hypothetical protein
MIEIDNGLLPVSIGGHAAGFMAATLFSETPAPVEQLQDHPETLIYYTDTNSTYGDYLGLFAPARLDASARMAGVSEMAAFQNRGLGSSVANITTPTQVVRPKSDIINVFVKTCQRWHLLPQHQIVLLGYKGGESLGQQLLDGSLLDVPQDVQERTGYILAIRAFLD